MAENDKKNTEYIKKILEYIRMSTTFQGMLNTVNRNKKSCSVERCFY